jgi:hypothetical protein
MRITDHCTSPTAQSRDDLHLLTRDFVAELGDIVTWSGTRPNEGPSEQCSVNGAFVP